MRRSESNSHQASGSTVNTDDSKMKLNKLKEKKQLKNIETETKKDCVTIRQ